VEDLKNNSNKDLLEIKELKKEITKFRSSINDTNTKCNLLQKDSERSRELSNKNKKELSDEYDSKTELLRKFEKLTKDKKDQDTANNEFKEEVKAIKKEKDKLHEKIKTQNSQIEKLKDANISLRVKVEEINNREKISQKYINDVMNDK